MGLIRNEQLGMESQVLLFMDLHPKALEHPQRGKRIENIPIADSVLTPAENTHVNAPIGCSQETIEDHRIDEFRMLNIELVFGAVDKVRHAQPRIRVAPKQTGIRIGKPITMLPVCFEPLNDLCDSDRIARHHAVIARLSKILHSRG